MRKIVLFMHTSLDGFVATKKGELNWIKIDEEMFDFVGQRTNVSDTALYGRVTYEMMQAYWPTAADQPNATKHDIEHSRWYKKVLKIVASRSLKGQTFEKTRIISDNLAAEVTKLKQDGDGEILIFGSPGMAHSLMKENVIDSYWLYVNPILLGEGTPLFKDINQRVNLKLISTKVFSSGVVCVNYERE